MTFSPAFLLLAARIFNSPPPSLFLSSSLPVSSCFSLSVGLSLLKFLLYTMSLLSINFTCYDSFMLTISDISSYLLNSSAFGPKATYNIMMVRLCSRDFYLDLSSQKKEKEGRVGRREEGRV